MKLFLIVVCLVLISTVFFVFDTSLTQTFAGITIGLAIISLWVMGSTQETAEYWNGTGPSWMQFIHKQLHKQNFLIQAKVQTYNADKMLCLVLGLFSAVMLNSIRDVIYWRFTLLSFLITWILGICLSEWYIRHKFTRINWKDL
jgi:hypothetical protein